jgi:uncharacterized membrane protein
MTLVFQVAGGILLAAGILYLLLKPDDPEP